MQVALTQKGMELAGQAFRKDMASELAFLEPLDERERDLLAGLLRKLILGIEARTDSKAAGVNAP